MSTSPTGLEYRLTLEENAEHWSGGFTRALGTIAGPLIGLILVFVVFSLWRPDSFFTTRAAVNVFNNNYHYAVAAIGATFVIVTGGIDLSVGSTMALSCVVCAMGIRGFAVAEYELGQAVTIFASGVLLGGLCGLGSLLQAGTRRLRAVSLALGIGVVTGIVFAGLYLIIQGKTFPPLPIPLAVLCGILAGALVGLVNGTLITTLSLPPFIVTLAMLEAVRGIALYITGALPISLKSGVKTMHNDEVFGLSPNVWLTILLILIATAILHFTVVGRYAMAIGSNEKTARLCGVNVARWKTLCYVMAGLTAGIAGVMMTSKYGAGRPTELQGVELTVIAAVVIGGTSLFGGQGTIIGSILGVLMLGFLYTGCTIADITPHVQRIFIGGTIVLAAALDRFRQLGR